MSRPVIAIFASGGGTTAEAFIHASVKKEIEPTVGLVITNNGDAGVIKRVEDLNKQYNLDIKVTHISGATHPAAPDEIVKPGELTQAEEAAILNLLEADDYDAVVLMGYMKKIGPRLIKAYGWLPEYSSPYQARMLNTHAGLFPETKGLFGRHKQERVIADGLKESGYTLHLAANDYDDGPIIAEHRTTVEPDETVDSLLEKDRAVEKKHLPIDVANFITERNKWRKQHG